MARSVTVTHTVEDGDLGPKMRALTHRQQSFVLALLINGDNNATRAAIDAGFKQSPNSNSISVNAHRLIHDARVQEAIQEEATRRVNAGAILAASELLKIAKDPAHKSQLKAIGMVLNRAGLHEKTEHNVNVQHTISEGDLVANIKALAQELGVDPKLLLGQAAGKKALPAPITDVEYEEVSAAGLEDLL